MPILAIDVMLAAVLVAALVVGLRRTLASVSPERRRAAGALLIAVPLPVAVGVELFAHPQRVVADAAFVLGLAAFAVGALLVLSGDGGNGHRDDGDPDGPLWWPDFERDFRAYARRSARPRALR